MSSPIEAVDNGPNRAGSGHGLLAKICRVEAVLLEFAVKAWVLLGCLAGAWCAFAWPGSLESDFRPDLLPLSLGCFAIAYFTVAPVIWLPVRWRTDVSFRRVGSLLLAVYVVVAFVIPEGHWRGHGVVQLVFLGLSLLWPVALIYFGLSLRWWLSEPVSLAVRLGRALIPLLLLAFLARAWPAYLVLFVVATPWALLVWQGVSRPASSVSDAP